MPKIITHETNYRKILEKVAYARSNPINVFTDWAHTIACVLAAWSREQEYMEIAKRYDKEELTQFSYALWAFTEEAETHPFEDRLWPYFLEIGSKSSQDARWEFYTPQSVSDIMALTSLNAKEVIKKGLPINVAEPACWSGGMILSMAKLFAPKSEGDPSHVDLLRVQATDLSAIACHMCFVNTSIWGIPAQIRNANTLTDETYNTWNNIHWYRVGQPELERSRHMISVFNSILNDTIPSEPDLTQWPDVSDTSLQQMDMFADTDPTQHLNTPEPPSNSLKQTGVSSITEIEENPWEATRKDYRGYDNAIDQYYEDVRESVSTDPIRFNAMTIAKRRWEFLTLREWQERIQSWRDAITFNAGNADKVILSLFDSTWAWSQPFVDAGYTVIQVDLDIMNGTGAQIDVMDIDRQWFEDNFPGWGAEVHGILWACPCTTFSGAGARWNELQQWTDEKSRAYLRRTFGDEIADKYESADQYTRALVEHTLSIIEFVQPQFWAIENPVGEMKKRTSIPSEALQFHPHNYGDPFTKATQIFGNFNPHLEQANVHPTWGSYSHNLRGDNPEDKKIRSTTFEGFAYSFFHAQEKITDPLDTQTAEQVQTVRDYPPLCEIGDPDLGEETYRYRIMADITEALDGKCDLLDARGLDLLFEMLLWRNVAQKGCAIDALLDVIEAWPADTATKDFLAKLLTPLKKASLAGDRIIEIFEDGSIIVETRFWKNFRLSADGKSKKKIKHYGSDFAF